MGPLQYYLCHVPVTSRASIILLMRLRDFNAWSSRFFLSGMLKQQFPCTTGLTLCTAWVHTVKDNPIASFPSTKLYLDVGRLLFSSFFFTSPRLSSYFLYFIKMSFHHINESQKKTMALLHKRGLNATDIAKDLKVSLSTVSRHLQKMKNDPNYFNKKTFPKNRKPCLDDRGERHLVRAALLSPFKTFTELGRSGVAGRIISRKTVARVLKRHGITKKVARRKPGLKKSCKIARLQFAKAHQSWTISEWNKVLFSDESNFNTRK